MIPIMLRLLALTSHRQSRSARRLRTVAALPFALFAAASCRQVIGVEDPLPCSVAADCNPEGAPCSITQCIDGECVYDPIPDGPGPDCGECVKGEILPFAAAGTQCYSASEETKNVGACKPGVWVCEDGAPACSGEVTPTQEVCGGDGTGVDEDCDGATDINGLGCACEPGTTIACFEGPEGAAGTGICVAGVASCEQTPDGNVIGECIGQVLPELFDSCVTTADEDCNGSSPACVCDHQYSLAVGGTGSELFGGGTVLADGTVVLIGIMDETSVTVGTTTVSTVGTLSDILLATFDKDGNPLTAKAFGGTGNDISNAVAPVQDGIWIGGVLGDGSVEDFGGGVAFTSVGGDGFLVKLNNDLSLAYKRKIGASDTDGVVTIAATPSGGVVAGGTFDGSVDVGGPSNLNVLGSADQFVVQYDAQGNYQWARQYGTPTSREALIAVDVSADGKVAIAGYTDEPLDYGAGFFGESGNNDPFVAVYEPNGDLIFVKTFTGAGLDQANGVAFAPDGSIWISGRMTGSLNVDGIAGDELIYADALADIFLVHLDDNGGYLGGLVFDGQSTSLPLSTGVFVGEDGAVFTSINFGGPMVVDGTTYSPASGDGLFLKLSPSGEVLCVKQISGTNLESIYRPFTDRLGSVYVPGGFNSEFFDLGGGSLPFKGNLDAFFVKYRQ